MEVDRTFVIESSFMTFLSQLALALPAVMLCGTMNARQTDRWSEQKADDWYNAQPWLVGPTPFLGTQSTN